MKNNKSIYVIDDERDICELVAQELTLFGYQVQTFSTGAQAGYAIKNKPPALCIIDLGLPDMDGMDLVRQLCDKNNVGVMILSGRNSVPDRILGLELGADDYIVKPFIPRELVARVNSLLRRLEKLEQPPQTTSQRQAHFGNCVYDPATLSLTNGDDSTVELSSAESELLLALLKAPKTILSRDQLLGENASPFDRSIDVRMSRVRKKIETDPKNPKLIKTIYGVGYMLTTDVSWS